MERNESDCASYSDPGLDRCQRVKREWQFKSVPETENEKGWRPASTLDRVQQVWS